MCDVCLLLDAELDKKLNIKLLLLDILCCPKDIDWLEKVHAEESHKDDEGIEGLRLPDMQAENFWFDYIGNEIC